MATRAAWLAVLLLNAPCADSLAVCAVTRRPVPSSRAPPVWLSASLASPNAKKRGSKYEPPKTAAQVEVLRAALLGNMLFRGLDESGLKRVVQSMVRLEVPQGREVITQGDKGDLFYVVERGEFDVFVADAEGDQRKRVHTYEAAPEKARYPSFGELALMYAAPRQASVVASTDGVLWALDRANFRKASSDGSCVVSAGGMTSVGVDTTGDGRVDTVLGMPRGKPKLLARLFRWLIGWIPATRLVRWLTRRVVRWLALCAKPRLLSTCVQICTAALALSELRSDVAVACANGECSIEVQEALQRTVLGVQATLEDSVEVVLAQLDEDSDGTVTLKELLQGGGRTLKSTAKAAAAAAATAAVFDAAQGGLKLLDELRVGAEALADDALGEIRSTALEVFEVVDTEADGALSLGEAIAAPAAARILQWWQGREGEA